MILCLCTLAYFQLEKDHALRRISSIDNSVSIKLSFCNIARLESTEKKESESESMQKTMKKYAFYLIDVINRY